MDDVLPFNYCDDKEFFDLLSVIKSNHKSKMSCSSIAKTLPYYSSTDYEMLRECLTNKDKFLEFLENNNFTSVYNNIIDAYLLKTFHVNIIMKTNSII